MTEKTVIFLEAVMMVVVVEAVLVSMLVVFALFVVVGWRGKVVARRCWCRMLPVN